VDREDYFGKNFGFDMKGDATDLARGVGGELTRSSIARNEKAERGKRSPFCFQVCTAPLRVTGK
jgi:hypothetical protein